MRLSRLATLPAVLAAATLALTACVDTGQQTATGSAGGCARSTDKAIAIDYPYNNLPLYGPLKRQAEARAAERGYTLTWTTDNADLDAQTTSLQALTAQKVPAIVTLPLEPTTVESTLRTARTNCTVVVSYAAQLTEQDGSIGLSTEASGRALAEHAVEWAKARSEPTQVFVLNDNDISAGRERYDGIMAGLAAAPAGTIEIVADQKATTPQQAASVAQQVLQANPEIDMVLGFNDDWALAGLQAMRNLGRSVEGDADVYVGGLDGAENALRELQKGNAFRATVGFSMRSVAHAMVDVPADLLEGKPTQPVTELPISTLTTGDPKVGQYLAELAK